MAEMIAMADVTDRAEDSLPLADIKHRILVDISNERRVLHNLSYSVILFLFGFMLLLASAVLIGCYVFLRKVDHATATSAAFGFSEGLLALTMV